MKKIEEWYCEGCVELVQDEILVNAGVTKREEVL